jgi:hypothetical protein
MKTFTEFEITRIARYNDLESSIVIPNKYKEIQYIAVTLKPFVTAFFLMNNETFDYTYSHTYNAKNDITTKRTPKIFI